MRGIVTIAWLAACERRKFESYRLGAWVYMGDSVVELGFGSLHLISAVGRPIRSKIGNPPFLCYGPIVPKP
jgi:hypothetical protein